MRQFITGTNADFADLEQRARNNCIAFRDQEMPVGTAPSRARIGFEVAMQTGEAILLVDRGVGYTGPSDELREWFRSGEKRFSTFADLRSWMRSELASGFPSENSRRETQ